MNKQGNADRSQSAANFAKSNPGKQPSDVYNSGDDYQNMAGGWMTCLTVPVVFVLAIVLALVVVL